MSKTYKIHPAIGVARLGNSPSFFVAAETLFGTPFELVDGREVPVQKFKDPQGRVKKQAARFRVFEYEHGVPQREITADDAEIVWSVTLANTKGSAGNAPIPASGRRNDRVSDRASLEITPGERAISGRNQASGPLKGKFLGAEVAIGELRTDAAGRLMVLGADGISKGPGRPGGFNNDGWYDDVADGPVNARIRFRGGDAIVAERAWVLTNSPDFAPEVDPFVSLYDIAFDVAVQKGWLKIPDRPSFRNDIYPILYPAAAHRWVEQNDKLAGLPTTWSDLADPARPQSIREAVETVLLAPGMMGVEITDSQAKMVRKWVEGNFVNDWGAPECVVTPEGLDRAHLARTSGASFEPGIEASRYFVEGSVYPNFYRAPFRIADRVRPGTLTERMSLPWQTDYALCRTGWWPAQRPNWVRIDANNPERRVWTGFSQEQMVTEYRRLGFIVPTVDAHGNVVFIEMERDRNLPHGAMQDLYDPDSTDALKDPAKAASV